MKKALLVIDMQKICVGKNSASIFKYDNEKLINKVNEVISYNKNNLVIYIKNVMKNSFLNRKFAQVKAFEGTSEVELVNNLNVISSNIISKYKGDAFSNKKLLSLLKENKIDAIEIIGVDGGGCVSLTAMGAIKNGFKVILNTEAIGTTFEKRRKKYYKKLKKNGVDFSK